METMAHDTLDQATATGRSLGVEEEFLLVDREHGGTVALAPMVLERARTALAGTPLPLAEPGFGGPALSDTARPALHPELLASQVEAATAPCTTLAGLREQLTMGRAALADAAGANGVLLVSSGVPPLAGAVPAATPDPR